MCQVVDFGKDGRSDYLVTPWEVEGVIDYDRLIREFGTQPITDPIKEKLYRLSGERHFMVERGVYYSHRDLDVALKEYEEGRKFFLYTGRGPSGPMHIGHLTPFYFTSWLQKKFDANVYIPLTDDEKFLEEKRNLSLEDARRWAYENAIDIAAAGFDPDKTFLFLDTEYMGNMYRMVIKVARRINFSVVRSVFGFTSETNIGLIFYPAVQIVPTFFEKSRCVIPCGIDQDPFWRLQRDIAPAMGYEKAAAIHGKLLPALTGIHEKMSTSRPETCIMLDESPRKVREKIYKYAFSGGQATAEEHRRLGGNPDVDIAYQWLYMFFEPDTNRLRKIEDDYRSGALLSGELKDILIEKVIAFLEKHAERREKVRDQLHLFQRDGKLAKQMWETVYQ